MTARSTAQKQFAMLRNYLCFPHSHYSGSLCLTGQPGVSRSGFKLNCNSAALAAICCQCTLLFPFNQCVLEYWGKIQVNPQLIVPARTSTHWFRYYFGQNTFASSSLHLFVVSQTPTTTSASPMSLLSGTKFSVILPLFFPPVKTVLVMLRCENLYCAVYK